MALFRMRSGDRSIAFAICSSVFLDLANSSKRRSSLKDQDFRTIAKKLPLQTNCKMTTQAVSRSPKALKGSLKRASPALESKPYSGSCVERAARHSTFCKPKLRIFVAILDRPQGPAGFRARRLAECPL
jgi:hypothetical protein